MLGEVGNVIICAILAVFRPLVLQSEFFSVQGLPSFFLLKTCNSSHLKSVKYMPRYTETHVISTGHFENSRKFHRHQIHHPLLSINEFQWCWVARIENQGGNSFHIIGQKREVESSRYGSSVVFRVDTSQIHPDKHNVCFRNVLGMIFGNSLVKRP